MDSACLARLVQGFFTRMGSHGRSFGREIAGENPEVLDPRVLVAEVVCSRAAYEGQV